MHVHHNSIGIVNNADLGGTRVEDSDSIKKEIVFPFIPSTILIFKSESHESNLKFTSPSTSSVCLQW